MPSLQRLKEFKQIAQEMIEDPKHKNRRHASSRRTKKEQQELYIKLKEYQVKHPELDVTSLFESHEAERARILMHKKAF